MLEPCNRLGYSPLKEEQRASILPFLEGKDVFVLLPTGFGKTVCYSCLPLAVDIYKKTEEPSIVIVISPLTSLIKDQVRNFSQRGVVTSYIDVDSSKKEKNDVAAGKFQIVFMSPELIVSKWRGLFTTAVYQKRLVGLVIDEPHCVVQW